MRLPPQPGETVWVIGNPDVGPSQFSPALLTSPDAPSPVFVVGSSDPAVDWPQFHPGPLSGSTGYRPLSCDVQFDAPAPGPPAYTLVLDVFASTGPCPQLQIGVNGRMGTFVLSPERESRDGVTEPMSPISGWAHLEVPVPASWLVEGQNTVRLTAVQLDEVDLSELERAPHPFFGSLFGSGVQYGRVGLYAVAEPPSGEVRVSLTPLPLYVEQDGDLRELADLLLDAPLGFESAEVILRFPDSDEELKVAVPGCAFGHVRSRLTVPALPGACEVSLDLEIDGVQRRVVTGFHPSRRWTVHVVPHVHLDVGYTDVQGKVIELHSRNVERAVDILKTNPDYAFSLDGSYILRKYFCSRSSDAAASALDALRSGRVSTQAFHTLFLTGLASLEECYRSAYYSAALAESAGVPQSYANLTDVPSYSWAIPSILADLGISSFMGIQNHARAANADSDVQHLVSPVRWQGPDGQEVLAFFADNYAGLRRVFADPPTVAGGAEGVCRLLRRYERDDYLPTDLPIVGSHADNEDLAAGEADLVGRWNEKYAYPRLRYSTIADYFAAVQPLRAQLPLYTGDGGSYWEDGVGSAARAMATYRRAQTALPSAECLLTLVADHAPGLAPPRDELDQAWQALEFGCEHTWTAYHAVAHPGSAESAQQIAWKVNQVETAAQAAQEHADRGMSQLAELLALPGPAVIVFNPLSWERTQEVEVDVAAGACLLDADGTPLPTHLIEDNNGLVRLRFVAVDVPAFGFRVFPLAGRAAPSLVLADTEAHATTSRLAGADADAGLSTRSYAVEVVGGRFTGLLHRPSGRQLLDPASPYSLGELLYVSGGGTASGRGLGSERTSLSDTDWCLPDPELTVTSALTEVREIRRTPWGLTVELRGAAPSVDDLTVELRVPDEDRDVEIVVSFEKQAVLAKESVYIAFPFAAVDPILRYDRHQGWVDPALDSQPGACVEWFASQYAVHVSGTDGAVVWSSPDAPLFTAGDVVRGRWSRAFAPVNGGLFSWVMNNHWWTNFPASQRGPIRLRYRFRPQSGWDPTAAARFGREARTPLLVSHARPLDKTDWSRGSLPGDAGALAAVTLPDGLVAWVVGGRTGDVVIRLQDVAGTGGLARLEPAFVAGRQVHRCTASERRLERLAVEKDGAVPVEVGVHRVVTVSLTGAKEAQHG